MQKRHESRWLSILAVVALLIGATGGWALFSFAPYHLIGSISKFVAVLIGTAWVTLIAFATKIADITESPALTPAEHRTLEIKCRQAVRRIWWMSSINFLAVIIVLIPSAMVDAKAVVIEWMTISAGIAFAFSIYSVAAHAWWQEELRAFRSSLRLRERELAENAAKLTLFSPTGTELTQTVEAEIAKHNRSMDWPND
ncbi:MAG: hypothetical protein FDZ72_11630 [Betaproteobacteria bacterium]|nr:MAG: hypothetical protein FDZ72_11630 [Betaproteobacteria bacterium]